MDIDKLVSNVNYQFSVLSNEPWKNLSAKTFSKRVLSEGTFWHPITKKFLTFTVNDLHKLAKGTNQYIEDTKEKRPFPDGHSYSSLENLGHWNNFRVELAEDGKSWLAADVEVPLDEHSKLIGKTIKGVSVSYNYGWKHTNGKTYDRITHVGATEYPVVPGQDNFVELSTIDGRLCVHHLYTKKEKEQVENLSELLAKLLGIKVDDVDEKTLLSAVEARSEKITKLETDLAEAKKEKDPPKPDPEVSEDLTAVTNELAAVKMDLQTTKGRLDSIRKDNRTNKLLAIQKGVLDATGVPIKKETLEHLGTLLEEGKDLIVDALVMDLSTRVAMAGNPIESTDPATEQEKDDLKDTNELMVRNLKRQGHTVEMASDGLSYQITKRAEEAE